MRPVPPRHRDGVLFHVPGPDLNPQGNPFFDPLPVTGAADIASVDFDRQGPAGIDLLPQPPGQVLDHRHNRLAVPLLADNGQQNDLGRGDAGGHDHAVVVGMGHDQAADETGGNPPGGRPGEGLLSFFRLEADIRGFGEILTEHVRSPGLEGLSVLHHGLDAAGFHGPGEPLGIAFPAFDDRDGQIIPDQNLIGVQHLHHAFGGLPLRGMGRMAFLPEKFGGPQKNPGAHLPADDIGPLIDDNRQIAIAFDPAGKGIADDRLRGGPDDQGFGQLPGRGQPLAGFFQAVMGDDGALLGKTFHVGRFLFQKAQGDENRKISVFDAPGLEHAIQSEANILPDAIAPGFNDHAAPDGRCFSHIRRPDDLLIPFGVIFRPRRRDSGLLLITHASPLSCPFFATAFPAFQPPTAGPSPVGPRARSPRFFLF